jgi:hypothetical protein
VIPDGLVMKYSRERVLRFLRRLVCRGGRALVGLSPFVLDVELAGLVRVPESRRAAAMVQITEAGRAVAALDGWTRPRAAARVWRDTAQEVRACPVCCAPWHGGVACSPRK